MLTLFIGSLKDIIITIKDEDGVAIPLDGSNYTDHDGNTQTGINADLPNSTVSIMFNDKRIVRPYITYTPTAEDLPNGKIKFQQTVADFDSPVRTGSGKIYAKIAVSGTIQEQTYQQNIKIEYNP